MNSSPTPTQSSELEESVLRAKRLSGAGGRFAFVVVLLTLLITLFLIVFFYPHMFVTIHSGERGVLWSRWTGTEMDAVYNEGTQFVWPWNTMVVYDVRYKLASERLDLLCDDGLTASVEMQVRYRPADGLLMKLHDQVGPDYARIVVLPEVATALRTVASTHSVDEFFQSHFGAIREEMVNEAVAAAGRRYVIVDDITITDIRLPETVSQAIQHKLQEQQAAEEMKYTLSVADSNAKRRIIESEGIEEQQRHINNTLTDRILEYDNIEATKSIANSPNAKIVVLGNGKGSTPIILNSGEQPASPAKR